MMVSLVLLVVVTLIALGSMRGVVMQARMSGASHDRSLTFQAAEAALREAEARAAAGHRRQHPGRQLQRRLLRTPAPNATPRWRDDAFAGWRLAAASAPANAPAPEAIVEDMGTAPNWYGCCDSVAPVPIASRHDTASRRAPPPTAVPMSCCRASLPALRASYVPGRSA
jgi:type IV pilus assembly protein PilX